MAVAASALVSPLMADPSTPGLQFDRVSVRWPGGTLALNQCSFTLPGPGLWMLVGSNGSGKSTLFRTIGGLIQPQIGRAHV